MNAARAHFSPYGWVMIFMLLALGVINFADKAVLGLAAVPIIKELHLSPAQYGLVSGSFFLLYALSSVLVTAWSDRIGTQKVLALLATSWAIVQVATVFVFSFPALCWEQERGHRMGLLFPLLRPGCLPIVEHLV